MLKSVIAAFLFTLFVLVCADDSNPSSFQPFVTRLLNDPQASSCADQASESGVFPMHLAGSNTSITNCAQLAQHDGCSAQGHHLCPATCCIESGCTPCEASTTALEVQANVEANMIVGREAVIPKQGDEAARRAQYHHEVQQLEPVIEGALEEEQKGMFHGPHEREFIHMEKEKLPAISPEATDAKAAADGPVAESPPAQAGQDHCADKDFSTFNPSFTIRYHSGTVSSCADIAKLDLCSTTPNRLFAMVCPATCCRESGCCAKDGAKAKTDTPAQEEETPAEVDLMDVDGRDSGQYWTSGGKCCSERKCGWWNCWQDNQKICRAGRKTCRCNGHGCGVEPCWFAVGMCWWQCISGCGQWWGRRLLSTESLALTSSDHRKNMLKTDEGIWEASQIMAKYYQKLGEKSKTLNPKERATNRPYLQQIFHDAFQEEKRGIPYNGTAQVKFDRVMRQILGLPNSDIGKRPMHNIPAHMYGYDPVDEDLTALIGMASKSAEQVGWNCG